MSPISQIQNVITTTFRANGNQAIAQMGAVAQGFGTVGRVITENTRLSERLNNQWRAIGTTIRYAVAGGAVFGLANMVNNLRNVQQQLGLMQAIGSRQGGLSITNKQITDLGANLRKTAVDTLTPVQQINDATVNFLSTVQNVKPSEIPDIMTSIGQAAKLAQTPVEDLTKAVTTSNIAFGRANNAKNIQEFNRMWFGVISTIPGGPAAAPEIANQMPALASMMALGQGQKVSGRQAQAQMLSLVIGALRTGATPSTGMRGLTYLLQSLIQPTGKARGALAGIGITPQAIYEKGVYANLMTLLNRITGNLTPRNMTRIKNLDDEALANIDESGGSLPGISAQEMTRLRTMIPRIHGIRAAVILAGQLKQHGTIGSLGQDLTLVQKEQDDEIQDALNMRIAWENFRKRSKLQAASVAINAMSLQVASIFEPVLNFAAGKVSGLQGVMQRHPHATRDVVIGGAAFLGALGLGRMLGVGKLPGINRIPGLRSLLGGGGLGIGNALVTANAAQAAISGNPAIGASPQNPIYVVVVGQLFGGGTKSPIPGGNNPLADPVNDYFGYKIVRGVKGAVTKVGRAGGRIARNPAVDALAVKIAAHGGLKAIPVGGTVLSALIDAEGAGGNAYAHNLAQAQRAFGSRYGEIGGIFGAPTVKQIHGHAEVYVNLDITGPGGYQQRKRVHVPLSLWDKDGGMWTGGRHPSTKGNPKTTRGG